MNKKIKEIDIKAFRAYKDMQKFDFTHGNSGKVADLVAIYAPNGYGKTSFFDAIEWAVTGTIERLNTGKPIKEEVKKEEDYILKNRNSDEEYGTVTIISEENDVLSVNTKKKTGKMKGDFKHGKIVKLTKELETIINEKESFCTTNLLAHDKITGFLQNYTAQDKSSELRVMWDENNYSKIINDINELYNELEKRKKQLLSELSKDEKELKKYKYENYQSDNVSNLLSNYEMKYGKYFMNSSSFDVENILVLFNQFHEESQKEREEREKESNDIEMLLKDYLLFEENQRKKDLLQKTKEEYDEAIVTWNKIEQIKKTREKITKEIEQIEYCLSNLEEFYSYVNQINLNITELSTLENRKIECMRQKISVAERIQALEEKLQRDNTVQKNLYNKEEQLKKDYYEYNINKRKKEKYGRLDDKANYILEIRSKRMQELSLYIEQMDLFIAGKLEISHLYNILSDEILDKYNSLIKLKAEQKLLVENNNILESNRKKLVELSDKIQKLSIEGRSIVIEQKQHECPLCHMVYKDYDELLDRISVVIKENTELARIDELIQKNKEREEEIDKELKLLLQDVEKQIFFIGNTYKNKCIKERQKVTKLQMKIETWEEKINTAKYNCRMLEEKYQDEKLDISEYVQLKNKDMEIEKDKKKIKGDIENVTNNINKEKDNEKQFEQNIQFCELRKIEIEKNNNDIHAKKVYIEFKKSLENEAFLNSNVDYDEMKLIIEAHGNQLRDKKCALDKELTCCYVKDKYSKDEYVEKLDECIKQINELRVEISSYLQRCEKLVGTIDQKQLLAQINHDNESMKNSLEIICEKIQDETCIITELSALKEQKMWMDKKQSVETKRNNLNFLIKRIKKLEKSKSYVEDYIVNKTNEYFNSDIINQIYNKIDPHPTMKHIKFITEKDNEGLKTHIYTYDESEGNKMSPVVYLSSAQVNILSLCIFLSKVLSEKNTTFNTIFIDDPIQHLDGINLLSFIDVLRIITTDLGRQIVISTYNEQFYKLLKVKMDEDYYPSKFIELTSTGKIKN